ncbi:MAG TPA: response regulator transcription factor [Propionicimonas sp.]|nr:response regulator transcription factor [Propionicimonas sp.]
MAEAIRVLLVDDESAITDSLGAFLSDAGFDVRVADNGIAALAAAAAWRPSIIVCDVLMPRLDGRGVVRELRQQGDWTPLILLTKVDATPERSAALDEGADDYLSKPFDPDELVARIRAVLRRATAGAPPLSAADRLVAGDLVYDRRARRIWLAGKELALTPRALLLLEYLMGRPGEVHSRDRLLSTLWGFDFPASTRAVDHRIAELRRVLNDDAGRPRFIETVQSLGYRFVARVDRA